MRPEQIRPQGACLFQSLKGLICSLRDVLKQMYMEFHTQLFGELRHRHKIGQKQLRCAWMRANLKSSSRVGINERSFDEPHLIDDGWVRRSPIGEHESQSRVAEGLEIPPRKCRSEGMRPVDRCGDSGSDQIQ